MIRATGPDGVVVTFPDGTPDSVILRAMARHQGAPGSAGYRGDFPARTSANLLALQSAIDHVGDHPRDLTNAVRIPSSVLKFAQNSLEAPIAAGVDQWTRPAVKAFNDAFHTPFDYREMSDRLLITAATLAAIAADEGSDSLAGTATEAPRPAPAAPFPQNLVHPRLFVADAPKTPLSRAGPGAPSVAREGVDLTLGQRMGGPARDLEARASRLPIVGPKIADARRRSLETFNRAVANRALAHLDETLPDTVAPGHAAAEYLHQNILDMVKNMTVWPDSIYDTDRETPPGAPPNLPPDLQREYRRESDEIMAAPAFLDDEEDRPFDGYSGTDIIDILSNLGKLSAKYRNAGGEKAMLADEIDKFSDKVRGLSYRVKPDYTDNLIKADQANELRHLIVSAAHIGNSADGVYTPADLMAAITWRYYHDQEPLVSPDVQNLYQFADRANQAMGPQTSGSGSPIGDALASLLASKTPEAGFVARLRDSADAYAKAARGSSNAFSGAPTAAAGAPGFGGDPFKSWPLVARTFAPGLSAAAGIGSADPTDDRAIN
jgi:hypothetical protein